MKRWMMAALCLLLAVSLTGCTLLERAAGQVSEALWRIEQLFSAPAQPEFQPAPTPGPAGWSWRPTI